MSFSILTPKLTPSLPIIFSYLPLSRTFNLIKHSKQLQSILNLSIDSYLAYEEIDKIYSQMVTDVNIRIFEKFEKTVHRSLPFISASTISNLIYNLTLERCNLYGHTIMPERTLSSHTCGVQHLVLDNSNTLMYSCASDGVFVWNVETMECVKQLKDENVCTFIRAVYPLIQNSNYLITLSYDMQVMLWDTQSNTSKELINNNEIVCSLIQLRSDNDKLILGCEDSTIKIYNFLSMEIEDVLQDCTGAVRCLCELNDMKIASGGLFADISIWNIHTKNIEMKLSGHNGTIQVLIQLNTGELVSGSGDTLIKIWSLSSFEEKRTLKGHKNGIRGLIQKSNLKNYLISVSEDNVIKVWDLLQNGKHSLILTFVHCHQDILFSFASLPNGRVATCSQDTTIKIWNVHEILLKERTFTYPMKHIKEIETHDNNTSNSNSSSDIKVRRSLRKDSFDNGNIFTEKRISIRNKRDYEYNAFVLYNQLGHEY